MSYPEQLRYTKTHEWTSFTAAGDAYVGITDYAQNKLGDLVFVTLPAVGDPVRMGESFADVESVKAVSEVLSPYTGIVAEVNGALMDAPQRINEAPYDSWFIRVTNITEHDEFLSAKEYEDLIAGGE